MNEQNARERVLARVARGEEVFWRNPKLGGQLPEDAPGVDQIDDAARRLERFAPFIMARFEDTRPMRGIIESPLREIPRMLRALESDLPGRLFLKLDSELPIAGSVKARGGIYEVLRHAEALALGAGIFRPGMSYEWFGGAEARAFFGNYSVQVGSTGNLGLSIGIMSAALGFRATVHMSRDAAEWKKELLRENGVTVVEYAGDYGAAVAEGRKRSEADPMSYFVDDENSRELFMGYAVAAERLEAQLRAADVTVDAAHPLFVYLPCGVGGAPGGITFGLKARFGKNVHCFFVEPTQAPCMLLGLASGLHNAVSVRDFGLTGVTRADGLAVGRPSGFVGRVMEPLLSGEFTVADGALFDFLRLLDETEGIFIEPSACAAFAGPGRLMREASAYIEAQGLTDKLDCSTHIAWATGGRLVPQDVRRIYLETHC